MFLRKGFAERSSGRGVAELLGLSHVSGRLGIAAASLSFWNSTKTIGHPRKVNRSTVGINHASSAKGNCSEPGEQSIEFLPSKTDKSNIRTMIKG